MGPAPHSLRRLVGCDFVLCVDSFRTAYTPFLWIEHQFLQKYFLFLFLRYRQVRTGEWWDPQFNRENCSPVINKHCLSPVQLSSEHRHCYVSHRMEATPENVIELKRMTKRNPYDTHLSENHYSSKKHCRICCNFAADINRHHGDSFVGNKSKVNWELLPPFLVESTLVQHRPWKLQHIRQ